MIKVCYTANDTIQAMARGEVCKTVESWDEACCEGMWDAAKAVFARRYKTKKQYVEITAVRIVPDDYKPVR